MLETVLKKPKVAIIITDRKEEKKLALLGARIKLFIYVYKNHSKIKV
jgi:hypothetical protein